MKNLTLEMVDISSLKSLFEDIDFDVNLPLIIALSSGLGVLFMVLLGLTIYFSFFNNGQGSIFLGSNFNVPGEFDDEETLLNDENTYLANFTSLERQNYFDGKNFQNDHIPITNPLGTTLNESEKTFIRDRGIQAYVFEQPSELIKIGNAPTVSIEDKLDARFINAINDEPTSVILNYPLPINIDSNNDTVYFEVKIFELDPESKVSIGLSSKPYPLFRLPGYNKYSIAYESDGTVRINQPFYSPSIWNKLIEGDVVGVGFKPRSGTIFFTHNGKKVLEAAHNVKFDLYPIIGSIGPAKLDTNIGQLGFVFIEANVKKWGFGSVYGTIGIPPAYGKEINKDAVLDKGEELPPHYPSEEDTFFGPSALLTSNAAAVASTSQEVDNPRPSKIINRPPSYKDEPKEELIINNETEASEHVDEVTERIYERQSSLFDQENNQYDPLHSDTPAPKEPPKVSPEVTTTEVTKVNIQDVSHQEEEPLLEEAQPTEELTEESVEDATDAPVEKPAEKPLPKSTEEILPVNITAAEVTPVEVTPVQEVAIASSNTENETVEEPVPESSPEPESTVELEATPEPQTSTPKNTPSPNTQKNKKKKKKKKGKKH